MVAELLFTGNEILTTNLLFKEVFNNFTYEFWVNPKKTHQIDKESTSGRAGIEGKHYAIGPGCGDEEISAGMGVSIGTNGVSVYEHSINYMPALLVYECKITDWTHIAIVYKNKTPFLYIDGEFVKKGLTSNMEFIFPSGILGGFSPYGFFQGSIKNLRIWKQPLTGNQISKIKNQNLGGMEGGIFWSLNHSDSPMTTLGTNKEIEVSVIIPSYNKYPQNLLTLYSLENQTFDLSKVEVIFVDDGSTDLTASAIMGRDFSYILKYIKCKTNIGRSKARNLGIQASSGKLIIFLDAEILVENDFIEQHYYSHEENNNLVVSSVMQLKGVYSIIFPDFDQKQLNHLYQLLQDSPEYLSKWGLFKQKNTKIELFTKEDIFLNKFKSLSFSKPLESFYENLILKMYGDHFTGFYFPWLAFLSGNVSLRKELLKRSGYFEERFKGYGWEDAELGYRLHLEGAHFLNQRNIRIYHQEHPVSVTNIQQARKNYQLFQRIHQMIDVYLLVLLEIGKGFVFKDINNILMDFKQLCKDYPGQFLVFKSTYKLMLKELCDLLVSNGNVRNDFLNNMQIKNKARLSIEKKQLEKTGKYQYLLNSFNLLINL